MKPDDISRAINDIDDELITAAEEKRNTIPHKKFKWIKTTAAAACLCIVFAAVFGSSRTFEIDAYAVAKADYPEAVPYPDETAYDGDEYSAAYRAWLEDRQIRMNQTEGYTDGMENFYTETMRELLSGSDHKNLIYSPLNIYMAMSMLAETTDGASRQQILDALGAGDIESLRIKASALWNANYLNDGATTSILANSIWLNQNVSFKQPAMDSLAEHYYASSFQGEMGSEELNQMLRDWINEQTGGLLKKQSDGLKFNQNTIMALASTVYFQARWSDEFLTSKTKKDIFHTPSGDITCDFMNQSETMDYYQSEHFSGIFKPLYNSGGMWLILPDEQTGIDELLADDHVVDLLLSPETWEDQQEVLVNLSLPKFDVSSDINLKDGLEKMGITDVFDASAADFSPMLQTTDPVFISQAAHAARVMVDEQGCTAAAYTVMMMDAAAMQPPENVDFVLDRPFLFVITGQDGTLLFAGVVNQPV